MKQKRKTTKRPSNSSLKSVDGSLPALPVVDCNMEVSSADVLNTANPQILYIPSNHILKDVKNNVTFYLVPQGVNQPNVFPPSAKVLNLNTLPKGSSPQTLTTSASVSTNASNTIKDPQTIFIPIGRNLADATKNVASILAPKVEEKKNTRAPISDIVNLNPFQLRETRVEPSVTTPEHIVDVLNSNNVFLPQKKVNLPENIVNITNPSNGFLPQKKNQQSENIVNLINSNNVFLPQKKNQLPMSKPAGIEASNQLPLADTEISQPVIDPVATLVFFDLETTGLGHQIGVSNVQITEITMIAMSRKEFQACQTADLKNVRVINKLSICTRPRSFVSSGAAKITGLSDYNLFEQNYFDKDTAEMICMFLKRLPKPVCLLAHNGDRYDYPLIKAEFQRFNMNLPSDIVTADTLAAFREIGLPDAVSDKMPSKAKNGRQSFSLENIHLHFFKRKPTAGHSSEGDCLALAKVCHKVKDNFLTWIDANTHSFEQVSPMW